MNEVEINKYIQNIPAWMKNVLQEGAWLQKVYEVAQKYSFTEEQTSRLADDVLFITLGIDEAEDLPYVLENEYGISEIISDQIVSDLAKRVFDFILKQKKDADDQNIVVEETQFIPANLPVSDEDRELIREKVGIPSYVPTSSEAIKQEEDKRYETLKSDTAIKMQAGDVLVQKENYETPSKITYKPASSPVISQEEVVQRASQVPRFDMNNETKPEPIETAPANNIIDQKLSGFTSSKVETEAPKQESPIVKSYSVDPYREPIE